MSRVEILDQREWSRGDSTARARFAGDFRRGLEATGFVVVQGHGVDARTIEGAYEQARRLFAQTESEKLRSGGITGGQRGFTPFGREHAKDQTQGDLKEFFHVGQEWPADHPRAAAYPENVWPPDRPELRAALLRLFGELEGCAGRLLEALALGYGLPQDAFSRMPIEGNSILRVLHYPPTSGADPDGALRAAPHEDINLITLLCEATDSGLEILTATGWLPVQTQPGQIVVDAGDMLCQVTGGVVPSITHRVVNPPPSDGAATRSRYSMPFFAHPPPECDLSVLPHFATPERVRRFPPIEAGAFLTKRLKEIGLLPEASSS